MKNPVFICGIHKSGTSFLRSLLDNHPSLNVLPIETHFINLLGFEIEYYYRRQMKQAFDKDRFIKNCSNLIKEYQDATFNQSSDAQLDGKFDTSIFEKELESKINEDSIYMEMFNTYTEAIFSSLKIETRTSSKITVEKSVENGEVALYYNNIFPEAKFIHIVRNPYANLVSLRKFKSEQGYPITKNLIRIIENNFYSIEKNKEILGRNYLIIKYEDILSSPNKSINTIAEFLNIEVNDQLFQPSSMGEKWGGNSFDKQNKAQEGINNRGINKWKEHVYPFEVFLINRFLSERIKKYGYDIYEPKNLKINYYKPIKKEDFKTYILNRISKSYPL
jgi:hypothetical protein